MIVLDRAADVRAWAEDARRSGRRIGFVPTMGYLHEGHLSLVRLARANADVCAASIFVNPLQFGPNEDLERYPRDERGDRDKLEREGVELLYTPGPDAVYGPGFQTSVVVSELTRGLCGAVRPVHFRGVTTVVTKLFNTVRPDVAVFGQKDYQQLAVIRRMVRDLDFGIEILGGPIVREADGLAMSSRNAYLSDEERRAALALSRSLRAARDAVERGERAAGAVLERVRSTLDAEPLVDVEYAELVDGETLEPVGEIRGSCVVALAAHVGKTRLIDNALLAAA